MFEYATLRVMLALACLSALSACSQTPSQKFEAMYAEQKATAPEFAAITKPTYEVRDAGLFNANYFMSWISSSGGGLRIPKRQFF